MSVGVCGRGAQAAAAAVAAADVAQGRGKRRVCSSISPLWALEPKLPLRQLGSAAATGQFNSGHLDFTAEKEKILSKRRDKDRKKGQNGSQVTDNVAAAVESVLARLFFYSLSFFLSTFSSISVLMTNISRFKL